VSEKIPTKERIIEVAECLFAEKGFDGTSMRDITEVAGVNLASVNYHFGSKDGLIAAVFHRYLVPLRDARLAMLDIVEEEAGNNRPPLEAVLEAFIRPTVVRAMEMPHNSDSFMRLMGRCLSEPAAHAHKHIYPHLQVLIERFNAAVAKAIPDLSREEIFWRMGFMAGAVHHALHMWSSTNVTPCKPDQPLDPESLIQQLISFAAAGLRSQVQARV
jgi:AcrR family transcriptional regulator